VSADRVPVSIVTGFLGSGKTTLIAALLKQPSMAGTAVVVNEFGAVGIDDAIFAETVAGRDLVLLANGCLCCTAGDDLALTLFELTRRTEHRPSRIVVETTGLADPVPLLQKLMGDPRFRQATRLDALVATVDAVNGLANLDSQPVAARQSALADRRIITKSDIARPEDVAALAVRLKALNPAAPILTVSHGAIDADALFGAGLIDARTGRANLERWLNLDALRGARDHQHHHDHDHDDHDHDMPAHGTDITTWLVEETSPVDWPRLELALGDVIRRHGDTLLRVKGVIRTEGDPKPLVIHGVQKLFHSPVRIERWPGVPKTSIVAIGGPEAEPAVRRIAEALRASVAAPEAA
jgi:G3E family GTPase